MRFTLVWAGAAVSNAARAIVVRSILATWRPPPPHASRQEPEAGFQVHCVSLPCGTTFFKVLWNDARENSLRFLRYTIFEEYKKAVVDERISPTATFGFQMDNTMQGMRY